MLEVVNVNKAGFASGKRTLWMQCEKFSLCPLV